MLYFDFETRSETDLRVTGPLRYSRDPTTEVLCCAYKQDANDVKLLDLENIKKDLFLNTNVEAHNAMFEYVVYHNVLMPKYDLPPIPQHRWYCSAALCASLGLPPSLEAAAQAVGLDVEKDAEGHRLMLKMCKPRSKWKRTGEGPKWFESPEDLARLAVYCLKDVEVAYTLSQKLRRLANENCR